MVHIKHTHTHTHTRLAICAIVGDCEEKKRQVDFLAIQVQRRSWVCRVMSSEMPKGSKEGQGATKWVEG